MFSGGIGQTGTRNFTKFGPGAVRFTAAVSNTYTGFTTVASGILQLQHSEARPRSPGRSSSARARLRRTPEPSSCSPTNQILNTSSVMVTPRRHVLPQRSLRYRRRPQHHGRGTDDAGTGRRSRRLRTLDVRRQHDHRERRFDSVFACKETLPRRRARSISRPSTARAGARFLWEGHIAPSP